MDAASVTFAPGQGQVGDPTLGWTPWTRPQGSWSASAGLQLTGSALQVTTYGEDALGNATEDVYQLAHGLLRLDLGGTYALTNRVGLGLSLPLYLSASQGGVSGGPALGETRLWVPVALTQASASPVAISLVPYLDTKSFADPSRFLGSSGFGFGGLAVLGWSSGPWSVHTNLGLELSPAEAVEDISDPTDPVVLLDHRTKALLIVGGSRAVGPVVLGLEGYAAPAFNAEGALLVVSDASSDAVTQSVTSPREIIGHVAYGLDSGLSFNGGAAVAASGAPGTPAWRAFLGANFAIPIALPDPNLIAPSARTAGPEDLVVSVASGDGKRVEGTVAVEGQEQRYQLDKDGRAVLPLGPGEWQIVIEAEGYGRQVREVRIDPERAAAEQLSVVVQRVEGTGAVEITVIDEQDRVVEDAEVSVDGAVFGEVGNQGRVRIEGLGEGEHLVDVTAEDFEDFVAVGLTAGAEAADARLVLERLAGSIRVSVRGPEGPMPQAEVRVMGPEPVDPIRLDPEGRDTVQLPPGQWSVFVSTEEFGLQQREVLIEDDFTGLIEVPFQLQPQAGKAALAVRVVDPDGVPVEGAEVFLGGERLGATASGGALTVEGLAEGAVSLQVKGERFRPEQAVELELAEGLREVLVTLDWLPGTVRVLARTPDGPVKDALVRFKGPAQVQTTPLGADGEGYFSLAAGEWTVILSAPSLGLQTRTVLVEPKQTSLIDIKAVLLDDEAGDANLTVRVTDPDGKPVADAEILLDGELVGTTASGGTLTLGSLQAGQRAITVRGALLRERVMGEVKLESGDTTLDVPMQWKPGSVRVRTTSASGGALLDALVRLIGPKSLPSTRVGADGERVFSLAPGEWLVVVSSESHGLGQQEVTVSPSQESLVELEFALEAAPEQVVVDELPKRPVRITVRTVQEAPVDAEVRFLGAERVDVGKTGADGQAEAALRPGAWEVIASAADYGAKREDFVLEPSAEQYDVLIEVGSTQVEVTTTEVKIKQQVFFEVDKATIRPESFALLDEVANTLVVNPHIRRVEVQGHTDNQGGDAYNQELSEARAAAVRDYLIEKGVSARRLEAKGYGNSDPIADNATAEGRAENRRVQFDILEQD
ncbi:MAG: OmpA family protein [Alphaproteobacteria bacterium]|nr:OmpA family protein [Alphaproteobacteria bacterium]